VTNGTLRKPSDAILRRVTSAMNAQSVAQSARAADAPQQARHVLFLSHAGVDAEAALRLADRIEATPEAREHGLEVWVDKRDLEAGSGWQQQLERAIEERSTAFAVYLGATGVINWVDSEVRVALSRARGDPAYRFIPIISAGAEGSGALPGFARQYQGVLDVENRPDELTTPAERTTRECSSPGPDPSDEVNSAGGTIAIDLD
jgi:hypothetical protein